MVIYRDIKFQCQIPAFSRFEIVLTGHVGKWQLLQPLLCTQEHCPGLLVGRRENVIVLGMHTVQSKECICDIELIAVDPKFVDQRPFVGNEKIQMSLKPTGLLLFL